MNDDIFSFADDLCQPHDVITDHVELDDITTIDQQKWKIRAEWRNDDRY